MISIPLKGLKQATYEKAFFVFKERITGEFERHQYVYDSGVLPVNKHKRFEKILIGNAKDDEYLTALQLLSECLENFHNEKVILLIDEYDVPLENAHFRGFYDEMVSLIRSVFESVLKTNPSLEFAVLTGCLRISKESIFTGMNNLRVYPVTDNSLSEYYGFTQSEVEALAEYYDMQDKLDELKTWYDGYLFGKTEIYNSWSIVNYISSVRGGNDISCKAYWINTSSNSIIHQLIENSD